MNVWVRKEEETTVDMTGSFHTALAATKRPSKRPNQ